MNKLKKFITDNWIYVTALVIPWIITLLFCLINGIWITGKGQIANGDMIALVIPEAYAFWDKIHMGDSLLYTWSLIDGVDFHIISDGLFSPFTLIMLLLPRKAVPDFMQFSMVANWSLCAFSMVYFFYNTKYNTLKEGKKAVSLFLGIAFALGNGIISYLEYLLYTEVIVLFPFLLLLVEKMVGECGDNNIMWYKRKSLWYYLLLTYCIFTYFYISFQICVFLALWFFIQIDKWDRHIIKKFIYFVIPSVMAGISNIGLLFLEYNLYSNRVDTVNKDSYDAFFSGLLIKPHEFVNQLFALSPIAKSVDIHPNIYMSITAVFIVSLFSVVKLNLKKKIYLLSVLVLFIVSFFNGRLNVLWHLNKIPNGFYNRFMFLYVFYMLFLALLVINDISGIKKKDIIISYTIMLAGMFIVILNPKDIDNSVGFILTMLIISFLSIITIYYLKKNISQKQLINIITICGIAELCISCFFAFSYHKHSNDLYGKTGISDRLADAVQEVDMEDFERLTCMSVSSNMGMIANKNADSGFVSAMNVDNRNLHAKLGMAYSGDVEFGSRGGSPLINLLFNVRCGIGESRMLFSDEELVSSVEDQNIYRTNRLAGLGYMVRDTVLDWDSSIDDCFEYQNDFVKKAVGETENLFNNVSLNAECSDAFGEVYEPDEEYLNKGTYYYSSEIKYGDENDARQVKIDITEDMDLYMYYTCPLLFRVHIFVDGEHIHGDNSAYMQSTYHIGNVKKGQEIIIVLVPYRSYAVGVNCGFSLKFDEFDNDVYDEVYEKLCRNVYSIDVNQSDNIMGTINVDEDGIMMTSIPYSESFSVFVDGRETEIKQVGEALIGVPLEQGKHTVEFRYSTPYLMLKWVILIGSVMVYVLVSSVFYIIRKKSKS